jgi:hypothetical protein
MPSVKEFLSGLSLATVISVLFAATTAALMIVLLITHPGTPGIGTISAKCTDNNDCTVDRLFHDGTCKHDDLSTDKTCSDGCYTSGHCDGHGGCTGTVAHCKGTCDTTNSYQCDNLWLWNQDAIDSFTWDSDTYGTVCFADRCTAWMTFEVLEDQVYSNPGSDYPVPGLQCKDFLDADFWAANGTCITTYEHSVEETYANDWFGETYYTFRTCEYAWNCAKWDHDAFEWWWD